MHYTFLAVDCVCCAVQPQASLRGEWVNVLLLVTLYAMQGVPLGLTMGSM